MTDTGLFLWSWSPVLVLTLLAVGFKQSALSLSVYGALYSLFLAVWVFHTPIGVTVLAAVDGVFTTLPLLLVIFAGILLSQLLMATGSLTRILNWFMQGVTSSFLRNLRITIGVGNFMEGASVIAEPVAAPIHHWICRHDDPGIIRHDHCRSLSDYGIVDSGSGNSGGVALDTGHLDDGSRFPKRMAGLFVNGAFWRNGADYRLFRIQRQFSQSGSDSAHPLSAVRRTEAIHRQFLSGFRPHPGVGGHIFDRLWGGVPDAVWSASDSGGRASWGVSGMAVGASIGSISSPFKIAIAAPMCDAVGKEGDILRWTIPIGIGSSVVIGMILLMAA